jgi:FkbM family methyltransferase
MRLEINMQQFVDITKKYFKDDEIKNIMEIGSLHGKDSLFFKTCFPNSNVYCIEGLPDNYEKYLKNLSEIIPINIVVADYDGKIEYYKKNINGLHGIRNRGNEYGSEILLLKCKTIKTICDDYNIPNIDLVKIDVEGATYEILFSMSDIINNIKIMHIETESYPFFENQKLHKDVVNFLTKKGFSMVDMTSVTINGQQQHDSVWINNNFL